MNVQRKTATTTATNFVAVASTTSALIHTPHLHTFSYGSLTRSIDVLNHQLTLTHILNTAFITALTKQMKIIKIDVNQIN